MDHKFALDNNILFTAIVQTAGAAGSTKMLLMGETGSNVSLQLVSKHDVKWDLGKCIIVKNLGVPILIGEPGKLDNKIITVPQELILTKNVQGTLITLPYHVKTANNLNYSRHFLCTAQETITLYPEDTYDMAVPSSLNNCEAAVTPRLEFDVTWLAPRVLRIVDSKVKLVMTQNA